MTGRLLRPSWRRALGALTVVAVAGAAWTAPGLTASAAEEPFTPGAGLIEAAPYGVNIVYNNANVGLTVAGASASYSSTSAEATATPFGFGLANLVAAITLCGEHPVPDGAFGTPIEAKSDDGGGQPVDVRGGTDGPFAFGAGHARAVAGADALAETKAASLDIPGLATIEGGRADARATTRPADMSRKVSANTSVDLSLLGGLVTLSGMRFHLEQVSVGADARTAVRSVEHSVGFGTVTVAGAPVPLPDGLTAGATALNTVLTPLGIQIIPPALVDEGQFSHRLTPLTLRIGGRSVYSDLVAALAGTPQLIELQQLLFGTLFDTTNCNQLGGLLTQIPQLNSTYNALGIATPILLAVVLNALAGGGSIDVQVGGIRSRIDDTRYEPPAVARRSSDSDGVTTPAASDGPSASIAATTSPPAVDGTPARSSTRCASLSPAGRPGCWSGAAPIGALLAAAVCGGLLASDEVRRRRHLATRELA